MMAAGKTAQKARLNDLLQVLGDETGSEDILFSGIATDSRRVQPGDLFIAQDTAIPYINDAVRAGAAGVLVDATSISEPDICAVPLVRVRDLDRKLGVICAWYFREPANKLQITAVTGTNGKSSVSYLLANALSSVNTPCGLIGTLGYGPVTQLKPATHTTPEPLALQEILADFCDQGIRQAVMEVSSHGIDQYRIGGLRFELAVFTNLSRDHLDYHGSFDHYAETKKKLFTDYPLKQAVINLDDPFGRELFEVLPETINKTGYTFDRELYAAMDKQGLVLAGLSDLTIESMCISIKGPWGDVTFNSRLIGQYNAQNLVACFISLCLLGHSVSDSLQRLSQSQTIPGRLEKYGRKGGPQLVIDYAHTPDALRQVLQTLKQVCKQKLYCVFGCGGNRDRGKREMMGQVADQFADCIIVTNDNPRYEDPSAIIDDIITGIRKRENLIIEPDRARAIARAIANAKAGDIILVAGKGHETYQEVAGERHRFCDSEIVKELLEVKA
jgi:UDP-N-acetylmuramoyl-L-alanyl-D-glutamate--2,6-diaminopimelate ligase